jgi:DNA processing protein
MMQERAAWLAWAQISGIGPVLMRRLQQRFTVLSAAWTANLTDLATVEGIGEKLLNAIAATRPKIDPEAFLAAHLQQNPQFWTPADRDYPRLLREIPDSPPVLYYRGNPELLNNDGMMPGVGIVGTRDPSDYAKRWTHKLSATLAKNGFTIISGMAEGIDTQAHWGCLEAAGHTIAVLGTGTDVTYPPRNVALHQRILQDGLVLSEYPAGTKPNRMHFPRRNRIIAALSRAVLVMEAPRQSGALITAYQANDYGRDVYVLPATLDNSKAAGCLGLMTKGAQLILGESHLLEALGHIPALDLTPQPIIPPPLPLQPTLSAELQTVMDLVRSLCEVSGEASVAFDHLVEQSSQPAHAISSALLQLELLGVVTQRPGMRYAVV